MLTFMFNLFCWFGFHETRLAEGKLVCIYCGKDLS